MTTGIMYIEADLSDILDYYVKGYSLTDGRNIIKCEPFVDALKDKVVFKIITESNTN